MRLTQLLALSITAHERQRISADNVEAKDKPGSLPRLVIAFLFANLFIFLIPNLKQTLLAGEDIIQHDVYAIHTAKGQQGVALPIISAASIFFSHDSQLPFQNNGEKIPITAGWLQKPAVDAQALREA